MLPLRRNILLLLETVFQFIKINFYYFNINQTPELDWENSNIDFKWNVKEIAKHHNWLIETFPNYNSR